MNIHVISLLGALVAFIVIVAAELHSGKRGDSRNLSQRLIAYVIFLLSAAAAGVAWNKYPAYGVAHALVAYWAMAVILIERHSRVRLAQPAVVFSILLAFVFFVVVIPFISLPILKSPVLTATSRVVPPEDIDMTFLESSLNNIEGSFNAVRDSIDAEAKNIESSISTLTSQLKKKRNELEGLNSEVARLSGEVDRYKELASLTENQIQAILAQLNRGKYIDYAVGLMMGLVSGLLVTSFNRFIGSLKKLGISDVAPRMIRKES